MVTVLGRRRRLSSMRRREEPLKVMVETMTSGMVVLPWLVASLFSYAGDAESECGSEEEEHGARTGATAGT